MSKSAELGARVLPIRPEILASKLASIRNYENPKLLQQIESRPRLVEMLWFIQAMSLKPGGLIKFTEELLSEFPERIGTPLLCKAAGRRLSVEEKIKVLFEIPRHVRPDLCVKSVTICDILNGEDTEALKREEQRELNEKLSRYTAETFQMECKQAAIKGIPPILAAMCTEKDRGFEESTRIDPFEELQTTARSEVWYFNDLVGAIMDLMDRKATEVQKRLAMTEVANGIFDALDYALSEKIMVRIEGGSRFGKTEAMQTWCDMRPGLARLVRVPASDSLNDFFKRVAEALGIDCSYGSNPTRLKERIEYIIQHSGLFLVLDEGAFLVPQNYSATSPPKRLNWIRTEIVDRKLPLAIAVTPQDFRSAVSRFIKKTSYTMEQFFGRNFLVRALPEVLREADLIAVARIHFPELDNDALGYIAAEARLSQNYLQAVEAIARRSRYLAARDGKRIRSRHIETAVAEVLPRKPAQHADRTEDLRPVKVPLTAPKTSVLDTAIGRGTSTFQARAVQPVSAKDEAALAAT